MHMKTSFKVSLRTDFAGKGNEMGNTQWLRGESVNGWVLGRFINGFSVFETQKGSVSNELKSC